MEEFVLFVGNNYSKIQTEQIRFLFHFDLTSEILLIVEQH